MAGYGECWGKDQYILGMWEYFSLERVKAKKFMKDAEKEKQESKANVSVSPRPKNRWNK